MKTPVAFDTVHYHDGFSWWKEFCGRLEHITELWETYKRQDVKCLLIPDIDDAGRARLIVEDRKR